MRIRINVVNREVCAVEYCVVSAGIENRRVGAVFSTKSDSACASGNVVEFAAVAVDCNVIIVRAVVGNLNRRILVESGNVSNNAVGYREGERLVVRVGNNFKGLVANRVGNSAGNRVDFNRERTLVAGNSAVRRNNVGNCNRAAVVADCIAAVVNAEHCAASGYNCVSVNSNFAAAEVNISCAGNCGAVYSESFVSRRINREVGLAAGDNGFAVSKADKCNFNAFANIDRSRSVVASRECAACVSCNTRRLASVDKDCIFSFRRNFNRFAVGENCRIQPVVVCVVDNEGVVSNRRAIKNLRVVLNQANASLFVGVSCLAFGNGERLKFAVFFACAVEVSDRGCIAVSRRDINFSAGINDSSLASRYAVGCQRLRNQGVQCR